jgi:AcrR family transcriptional regulator
MTVELPSPPRLELAGLTEERIMKGLSGLLTNGDEVTFRALSRASGVPERTLYRYYPSREALLAAFWTWLNDRLGMPAPPKSPQDLIASIAGIFAAFAADEPLIRAMLHDPQGRATRLAHGEARRARLRNALQPVLAPLEATARRRLLVSIHALISAAGWETMRDYGRVSSPEAADAAQWAVATLIAEAGRRLKSASRKQK